MFKLQQEPWTKADLEGGWQRTPILSFWDNGNTFIHLTEDDHEYELIVGIRPDDRMSGPVVFKPITHWPREILKDIVDRFPLED